MKEDFLIKNNVLQKYIGKDECVVIPDGITSVSPYAFSNCNHVKQVIVAKTVTEISNNAFYGCSGLEKISMTDSVNKLGFASFALCTELREVVLSSFLEEIPYKCFYRCINLTEISLPANIMKIGKEAFSKTGIKKILIPESVSVIDSNTFSNCKSLEKVIFPENLLEIGINAFLGCMFEDVIIPRSVRKIRNNAFYGCSQLKSLVFKGEYPKFEGCPFCYCDSLCDENGMLLLSDFLFYSSKKEVLEIPEGIKDRQQICNAKTVILSSSQKQINISIYQKIRNITMYDSTEFVCNPTDPDSDITPYLHTFFRHLEITCLSSQDKSVLYRLRIDLREEHPDLFERMSEFAFENLSSALPLFDRIFKNIRNLKSKADIAFDRLEYGYALSDSDRNKYRTFLESNAGKICLEYLKCKDDDGVYKIAELNCFKPDDISKLIEYTSKNNNEIMSAFFLNYSYNKFSNIKNKNDEYL